ncbi:electron transfer flavoprotein subunit beta/FixA family protein [Pseudarthrobacter sp. NIBRBAC000502772]|uniref:electron transfer flavoprotein subunit beta/FixA family protein n=1 Tax=Pseudarthrobacter sp. NIBRBAC000502772 TaxID=2590775 RepID=UPI00113230CC|nr:electron transfer flavoprotein subunit beta/FixA family protein [Pseudarthrobacter sp. NIBRBAC000502772]QDG66719.1 electron transfer flavoprotein subunit beta/FixA family protein [Pseudarthrobacter sp. NIBRBAC000502772]
MKIVVLVKQVPDTWGDRTLNSANGRLDRSAAEAVIDEINERALEVALRHRDANKGTEVVALSMGPVRTGESLRKALAMGADSAVHVLDDALAGADAVSTARSLAAALAQTGFDLVIAGNASTDGRGGVVPTMVAELLSLPALSNMNSLTIDGSVVRGERETDFGTATVHAATPAVVSVTERMPEGRFPNFKGIISAKRKPVVTLTLQQLRLADAGGQSIVTATTKRPVRAAGQKVVDDGTAADALVAFLATERLI